MAGLSERENINMSGLMNSYFYGKAGKADYTPENLPTNRVQLFFEVLRVRFGGLFGVNLLNVLFLIPAIIWTFMTLMVLMAGAPEGVDQASFQFSYITVYLALMVPFLGLAGVGQPGVTYVLRNWARDQHSFVMSDFKDAVKGNWKHGLAIGLINGASLLVTYVCTQYYGQMAMSGTSTTAFLWVIPQTLVVVMCALWWMMNMVIYPMMVTYEMKLGQLIRNSAIMIVARLPWSVLIGGLSLAIPVVVLVFVPYGLFIIPILYLLIGFALTGLIHASYANSCFDRFLNPRIEGAEVNMGLRDPAYEDLEDEEEEEQ